MKEDISRPKNIKGDNYLCETGVSFVILILLCEAFEHHYGRRIAFVTIYPIYIVFILLILHVFEL